MEPPDDYPANAQPSIELAREDDLPELAGIEIAAAVMLRGHAPDSVLATAHSIEDLREACSRGTLWVARVLDLPVGFACVELHPDRNAHLEELDVHPSHGRRGIGTALVRAVLSWANSAGYPHVTLSTFRAVPWNMPFYARLGFEEIAAAELSPTLEALVRDEEARGMPREHRVVMRHRFNRGHDVE